MSVPASIWTVCTLGLHRKKKLKGDSFPRTWGYAFTKDEAVKLLGNCDDECGYYTHAVIENFKPGIYSWVKRSTWFRFDFKKRKWAPCRKPRSRYKVVNFGMG